MTHIIANQCEPTIDRYNLKNILQNVVPNPETSCGPYHPLNIPKSVNHPINTENKFGKRGNHDTIGMIALDHDGHIAAGTSTNGASFKIPGYDVLKEI